MEKDKPSVRILIVEEQEKFCFVATKSSNEENRRSFLTNSACYKHYDHDGSHVLSRGLDRPKYGSYGEMASGYHRGRTGRHPVGSGSLSRRE